MFALAAPECGGTGLGPESGVRAPGQERIAVLILNRWCCPGRDQADEKELGGTAESVWPRTWLSLSWGSIQVEGLS
jgi:hypothetical protein